MLFIKPATIDQLTEQPPAIVSQAADDYHGDTSRLSRSQLTTFIESRKTFYRRYVCNDPAWQQATTEAMRLGSLFHELVLEHSQFEDMVAIVPRSALNADGHKMGNAYKRWKEQPENACRLIMKADEAFSLQQMFQAIIENDTARTLLYDGDAQNEMTVHWHYFNTVIPARARLDRVREDYIVDLKTIDSVSMQSIERAIESRLYYMQAAIYQDAIAKLTASHGERKLLPFVLVFVEKQMPFEVISVELSQEYIDEGRQLAIRALHELQHCLETNDWTPPTGKGLITVDRPSRNRKWSPLPWQPTTL